YEIGMAANLLGAGRMQLTDAVDPAAGIVVHKKIGERVSPGEPVFTIFTHRKHCIDTAVQKLIAAVRVSKKRVTPPPLVSKTIS
ncbi:MAG TPA: thymidine phosphorylase, partial [bacterium]|nr:thymidine phosphorylase [bacterium]